MLSAPPAAAASAWKATASIRRRWSSPWPACQAWHSPARAAAVASARPPTPGPGRWLLRPRCPTHGWRRRPCQPLGGRVGGGGGRWLVGHRRCLAGEVPGGRGGDPADRQHGHQRGRGRLDRAQLAGHSSPPGERVGGRSHHRRELAKGSLFTGKLLCSGRGGRRRQQPGQPTIAGRDRPRIDRAVQQSLQGVLVAGWRPARKGTRQWMHVGPKSVLVAHRVTPRTSPAASSRLASRRNPRWASTRTAPGRLPIVTPGSAWTWSSVDSNHRSQSLRSRAIRRALPRPAPSGGRPAMASWCRPEGNNAHLNRYQHIHATTTKRSAVGRPDRCPAASGRRRSVAATSPRGRVTPATRPGRDGRLGRQQRYRRDGLPGRLRTGEPPLECWR